MIQIPLSNQFKNYPAIKSISPIAVNTIGEVKILGKNFTPQTTIVIEWTGTINNVTVLNDEEIVVGVQSPSVSGFFDIEVINNDVSSSAWGNDNQLEVYQPFSTGWIDFRSAEPNIVTTANYNLTTQTFANSGLVRSPTEGLTRNSTSYSNFQGFFNQFQIPSSQTFELQFILKFFSGAFVVSAGFSTQLDFSKTIRESSGAVVSLENRSYSIGYFGEYPNYFSKSFVTGTNWNNNFIHYLFQRKPGDNLIKVFSRGSLTYNWDAPENGEFICQFEDRQIQPSDFYYPCIELRSASSQGFIVAMKIN